MGASHHARICLRLSVLRTWQMASEYNLGHILFVPTLRGNTAVLACSPCSIYHTPPLLSVSVYDITLYVPEEVQQYDTVRLPMLLRAASIVNVS